MESDAPVIGKINWFNSRNKEEVRKDLDVLMLLVSSGILSKKEARNILRKAGM